MVFNLSSYYRGSVFLAFFVVLTHLLGTGEGRLNPLKIFQPLNSKIPSLPARGTPSAVPQVRNGFVRVKNGHFYLGNRLFDFRGFNAPTLLDGTVFENTDLLRSISGLGTAVTRTYTLKVANAVYGLSTTPEDAHITGWDKDAQDWIYNEQKWKQMDKACAIAAENGVKLILPIINQDYGDSSTDFKGNFIDLIRHRFDIKDYASAQISVDWFVDPKIRIEFKKIIKKLLTRTNTVNGRVYGHDDVFLAFQTGNEMNWANITAENNGTLILEHKRPAPADWTIEIAKYIKSLAPKALVIDGSFARNSDAQTAWPEETLRSPYVDIFSYHMYGTGDISLHDSLNERVKQFGKLFVITEHGFYDKEESFAQAYKTFTCPGALVWSLRPHAEASGFETHSEGANIFSYHVPGWTNSTSTQFDAREAAVVRLTYQASFDIINKNVPKYPVPGPPSPFFATNDTHTGISWKGAAWAEHYEVWGASDGDGKGFSKVAGPVYDNVDAGDLFIPIQVTRPTASLEIPYKPQIKFPRPFPNYFDPKWVFRVRLSVSLESLRVNVVKRSTISAKRQVSRLRKTKPSSASGLSDTKGGWYVVRGFSADGVAGIFSKPTFISSDSGP